MVVGSSYLDVDGYHLHDASEMVSKVPFAWSVGPQVQQVITFLWDAEGGRLVRR